jgi:hypothetical protein
MATWRNWSGVSCLPQLGRVRQAVVQGAGHRERAWAVAPPAVGLGDGVQVALVAPCARAPPLHVIGRGHEVALAAVAPAMCRHQVVEPVVGVAGPRDEVVDLGGGGDSSVTIEAAVVLEVEQRSADRVQRHTLGPEQEGLELGLGQLVHRGDLQGPLAVEERAQDAVQSHEVRRDAGLQQQPVVERSRLAPLVCRHSGAGPLRARALPLLPGVRRRPAPL